MGTMSTAACEHARGQLALFTLGRLPDNERLALEAHLDGCEDCRSELAGLSGLSSALSAADPDRIDHVVEVPETRAASVLDSLGTEVARHRRSTRVRFASAAAESFWCSEQSGQSRAQCSDRTTRLPVTPSRSRGQAVSTQPSSSRQSRGEHQSSCLPVTSRGARYSPSRCEQKTGHGGWRGRTKQWRTGTST